jgi:tRNA nucleotidyltransferase (CCA-adding enzyme)
MSKEHVSHSEIARFAEDKVNLPKDKADAYRDQANRLRDKLEGYIGDHPDFSIRRIMMSGSLAKGSALKSLNDIDLACYIEGASAPKEISKLLEFLAEKLRTAFPNFKPEQVKPQTYSVTVSFIGSGLDVDVVPILYYGDKNWYGNLVSQEDGSFLETCIPRHIEFIKSRKSQQKIHFVQVIRLAKFWARFMKSDRNGFRFKSFMIELILSKLLDQGKSFSDYIEGLQHFFTYLATSNLNELIYFTDYYGKSELGTFGEPVRIIDPVNPKNNASKFYTKSEAQMIIDAALDAGDAIDAALSATTKEKTIYYWQKVFGPSFQI